VSVLPEHRCEYHINTWIDIACYSPNNCSWMLGGRSFCTVPLNFLTQLLKHVESTFFICVTHSINKYCYVWELTFCYSLLFLNPVISCLH
jgi:hypothetical protein